MSAQLDASAEPSRAELGRALRVLNRNNLVRRAFYFVVQLRAAAPAERLRLNGQRRAAAADVRCLNKQMRAHTVAAAAPFPPSRSLCQRQGKGARPPPARQQPTRKTPAAGRPPSADMASRSLARLACWLRRPALIIIAVSSI